MDTGRLVSIIDRILSEEEDAEVQDSLREVYNALNNLSSNPADQNFQTKVKDSVEDLEKSIDELTFRKDPTFLTYVKAIRASRYFTESLVTVIQTQISDNAMTPAVARDKINEILSSRQKFLDALQGFLESSRDLNISHDEISEGESQIGFRIPREIFDNELKGWTAELVELKNIIRPFSELATGGYEPIKIGEISTTDPIIFLILSPVTVAYIAKCVSWSLDQWKKVEEIRKLRAETKKISESLSGSLDEMIDKYDNKIKELIENSITEKSKELVPESASAGRHNELRGDIERALHSLVARIERGMTVEIKFLPTAAPDQKDESVEQAMTEIKKILSTLLFPEPSPLPVISLPDPKSTEETPKGADSRTSKAK